MITPSFGLTATERVLPRLALDFTTASLDPRITFTRALNTATRINASGVLEVVNADVPRFDYDPSTLACKGLLIEESRTNILTYSENFADAVWNVNTTMGVAGGVTDPWGGTAAFTLTANGANSLFGTSRTGTSGIAYTGSIWIRRRTGSGTIVMRVGDNISVNITSQVSSSWSRVAVSNTPTTTTVRFFISLATSGNAVDIWGAQLEVGAFPTSYIPTTTTSLTRNADVATMTGTNFSDWFNASEGTFVFQGSLYAFEAGKGHLAIRSSSTDYMRIRTAPSGSTEVRFESVVANVSQVALTPSTINVASFAETFAYKQDDYAVAVGRGTVLTDTSGTVPTANAMYIGATPAGVTQYNGHIQKILYYPQRLINAEVQALSK